MPRPTSDAPLENLVWAQRVWDCMSRLECAGVLHIALRYGERQEHTNAYIDTVSEMEWKSLGRPLQLDVMRALLKLQAHFDQR
jgi:hypothetical protein